MATRKKSPESCSVCTQPAEGDAVAMVPLNGLALPSAVHQKCLDSAILWHHRFRHEVAGLLLRVHDLEGELARRDDGRLQRLVATLRAELSPRLIMKGSNGVEWWGCQVCSSSSMAGPEAVIHRAGCVVAVDAELAG